MGYLWANMEKIDVQAEREKSRRKEAEMQAEIDSMQAERDVAQAELDAAQAEITRLHSLLAEHGIEKK